jgi:hypothetical protein
VRNLRGVIEEIDPTNRVNGSGGPQIFLALQQGRWSLSCQARDDASDKHPVFIVELLCAEGIRERGDGGEFPCQGLTKDYSHGNVRDAVQRVLAGVLRLGQRGLTTLPLFWARRSREGSTPETGYLFSTGCHHGRRLTLGFRGGSAARRAGHSIGATQPHTQ